MLTLKLNIKLQVTLEHNENNKNKQRTRDVRGYDESTIYKTGTPRRPRVRSLSIYCVDIKNRMSLLQLEYLWG